MCQRLQTVDILTWLKVHKLPLSVNIHSLCVVSGSGFGISLSCTAPGFGLTAYFPYGFKHADLHKQQNLLIMNWLFDYTTKTFADFVNTNFFDCPRWCTELHTAASVQG